MILTLGDYKNSTCFFVMLTGLHDKTRFTP